MRRSAVKARRGITLIELLIAIAVMSILASAITFSFIAGLNMQRVQAIRRQQQTHVEAMEQRISLMIQGARLSTDTADATQFFIGRTTNGQSELGCAEITFTTSAPAPPMAAMFNTDDFETQHEQRGPIGGIAEVSLSMTPVGNANNRTGLFERIQRPSDGDPTQGGIESVLSEEVENIGFQFWNGAEWVSSWDSVNGDRRLPSAVKVSYTLRGAPTNAVHVIVALIPQSDVDSQNPVNNIGT